MSDDPTPSRKIARQATSAVAHVSPEPDADDPLLAFAPFHHKAPRRNSITPELQRRFVATLAATGIVKVAAKRVGKSLEALYKLRARPGAEGFAEAWDAALERGVQRLEDIALERAMLGTRTPIVSGGEILALGQARQCAAALPPPAPASRTLWRAGSEAGPPGL